MTPVEGGEERRGALTPRQLAWLNAGVMVLTAAITAAGAAVFARQSGDHLHIGSGWAVFTAGAFGFLTSLAIAVIRPYRGDLSRMVLTSVVASLVLLVGIGSTWYVISRNE